MPILKYIWKPAQSFTPGRIHPISAIILHSTDGNMPGCLDTLTGTDPAVSSHWLVDRDGTLYHLVQDSDTAYHAGVVDDPVHHGNAATIGIEQVHLDGQESWPDALVQTTSTLVAALRQKHGLSLPVLSHAAVARPVGRKQDPKAMPWDDLHTLVTEALKQTWVLEQA